MFQNINFSNPTWDLFGIIFFVAAAFIFGISLGKARIITILVSLYMTSAVMAAGAPFLKELDASFAIPQLVAIKVSATIVIFLGVFFLVSRTALQKTIATNDEQGSLIQIIIFSFFLVGLLINTALQYGGIFSLEKLTPTAKFAFGNDYARFFWVGAPILAMLVFKNKKKE